MDIQETMLYFVDETGDPGFGTVAITRVNEQYSATLNPSLRATEPPSKDYCIGWIQIPEIEANKLELRLQTDWKGAWGKQHSPAEPKWGPLMAI